MTSADVNSTDKLEDDNLTHSSSKIKRFFTRNFNSGENKKLTILGHFLITSGLIVILSVSYLSLNLYAANKAKQWLKDPVKLTSLSTELKAEEAEKARLAQQLKVIEFQIHRYSEIMVFFSNHYYTALILTSASALVAAICLFFISKKGWDQSHNSIINIFIVASSAVVFFGDLPGIFKEEDNFKAYGNLYIEHIALRNEILSYMATGGTVLGKDPQNPYKVSRVDVNQFIHSVDNKLAQLNKIPLGFDATRIRDSKTIVEKFNNTKPTVQAQ